MQLPSVSDTVRVDAGFVAGDEVSAHYDPMIAKLIVQGPTRTIAIQKLYSALEDFEIAGLVSNIEFLKRVCKNAAFTSGDVETGFINKQKDELLADVPIDPEVYAQAALGSFMLDAMSLPNDQDLFAVPTPGWSPVAQTRTFKFNPQKGDGKTNAAEISVTVKQLHTGLFDVAVDELIYHSVACEWDSHNRILTSFLPHTRLETRIIRDESNVTMFQQGLQYRIQLTTPKWIEKALGIKDTAHSVLAPMPCKILRVDARVGDVVKKDQTLVVIESMKMETVIRSPQDGIVSRVVHQQGVSSLIKYPNATANFIRTFAEQAQHW